MKKLTGMVCGLMMGAGMLPAHAADDKSKVDQRMNSAANVITEVMHIPEKAIPQSVLAKAHCVIVVPGQKKAAFLVGVQYGQGAATCRTGHGWSAPVFVKLEGVSYGFQIGGQSTDLILLGMNAKSAQDMLHAKVKLGADASAAAGPVGRSAQASTDVLLNSEFLTYSRAKGLFAGLDLSGDYLSANDDDMHAEYGPSVNNESILDGNTPTPPSAQRFVHTVAKYFVESKANQ